MRQSRTELADIWYSRSVQSSKVREKYCAAAAARGTYSNQQDDGWSAVTYFYVPVIPARPNNNAGALGITGGVIAAQASPMYGAAPYTRGAVAAISDISKPRQYGLYGAFDVYVHHQVHVAGLYSDNVTQGSSRWDSSKSYLRQEHEAV